MPTWLDKWFNKKLLEYAHNEILDLATLNFCLDRFRQTRDGSDEFCHMLREFITPETNPLSFQLPRDLACMLAASRVAQNVLSFGCKEIAKAGAAYIDLPPGSIRFNDKLELMAIFVRSDGAHWMEFTAIVKDEIGEVALSRFLSCDRDGIIQFKMLPVEVLPGALEFRRDYGVEMDQIMFRVAEFSTLVVAHAATVSNGREELLPYLPSYHARRTGRKARQVAKKFSLFSVRRLSSSAKILGRSAVSKGDQVTGIRLDCRVTVRGHFRMQACGPGRSRRRLCWIDEHERGPEHALRRLPMLALRSHVAAPLQVSA
ncbi:hypothetical protein [Dongia sp.]|uniref:hypothetical protein n=1 Tax=Dongia sp. TaxID=1977262 RepID=UPI0035AEE875